MPSRSQHLRLQYLVYTWVCRLIGFVYSAPTLTSNIGVTSTFTPSATPTVPSSDRSGDFQVLPDGSQDLAALIGIFATDSVEKYAIDYSKGYLSTCVATLSLLGLLGWARAMVKLGLGLRGCENAGFNVKSVRPIFGVSEDDRLPSDKVFDVHYIQRSIKDNMLEWKNIKTVKHTTDSMPFIRPAPYKIVMNINPQYLPWELTKPWFGDWKGFIVMTLLHSVCAGATCFAILPFRDGTHSWSWSTYLATFGLFNSILVASLAWFWVFIKDQVHLKRGRSQITVAYALMDNGFSFVMVDGINATQLQVVRFISFVAAFLTIIGYICQYIEVRRMSAVQSAIWLAIQGALAIIRVLDISYTQICLAIEYASLMTRVEAKAPFEFPMWIDKIFKSDNRFGPFPSKPDLFETALEIREGTISHEVLDKLRSTKNFWDMSWPLFMIMVDEKLHQSRNPNLLENENENSCRIVKDSDDSIYFLPYISFFTDLSRTPAGGNVYCATFNLPSMGTSRWWNEPSMSLRFGWNQTSMNLRFFGNGRSCFLIGFDQKNENSLEKQHILIDGLEPFSEGVLAWLRENGSMYFPGYKEPTSPRTLVSMINGSCKLEENPARPQFHMDGEDPSYEFDRVAIPMYSEMWNKINTSSRMRGPNFASYARKSSSESLKGPPLVRQKSQISQQIKDLVPIVSSSANPDPNYRSDREDEEDTDTIPRIRAGAATGYSRIDTSSIVTVDT